MIRRCVIRDLTTLAEIREVMALEQEIWGAGDPGDNVGLPIFVVTLKRGGVLLGAFDSGRLVGFVYALPGLKAGRPVHWSHMLGVREAWRGAGVGRRLKWAQRERALAMGIDLIEWTFDPLQAVNARLNFEHLGVVVEEHHEDVYGESTSPLHRGTATDRFVAQWWLRSARVERLAAGWPRAPEPDAPRVIVLRSVAGRAWPEPAGVTVGRQEPEVAVQIPGGFTGMLARDPALARAWRQASREVFTHYLARRYCVVDFQFDRASGGGTYVLSTARPPDLEQSA